MNSTFVQMSDVTTGASARAAVATRTRAACAGTDCECTALMTRGPIGSSQSNPTRRTRALIDSDW